MYKDIRCGKGRRKRKNNQITSIYTGAIENEARPGIGLGMVLGDFFFFYEP